MIPRMMTSVTLKLQNGFTSNLDQTWILRNIFLLASRNHVPIENNFGKLDCLSSTTEERSTAVLFIRDMSVMTSMGTNMTVA